MYDDMQPDNMNTMPQGEPDREGAMAKADLYKLANYSLKLFKKLQDEDQLEGWVQAKITKSADYIASVYHYLEYEMKVSEYGEQLNNAEMMSESRKQEIKTKLVEAKEKIKALKMAQAEKLKKAEKPKKVDESVFGGDEQACEACGGSGKVMTPEREIPEELKAKVEKYNRRAKAFTAASKRIDRNKNGIPDDEEVSEEQGELKKTGDSKKTSTGTLTKTDTGVVHKNTSYADGGDDDIAQRSGKGKKSHAKSQSAAEKKSQAPKLKQSPKSAKTWGMKDGEKFDNRDKEKEVSEVYGQGVYEGEMTRAGKGVMKYGKDGMKALAKAGKEGKDLEPVKAKYNKYDEATEPKDVPKKGEKMGKEGNAFGKAVRDAKADGVQKGEKVKVGGKEYPVKESAKPDFLDMDKDGDKKEPMKKAVADKKKSKKVDESADWKAKASTLRDSLESMLAKKSSPVDETLEEMMALAAEIDAEGLAEASKDPAMLDEFLQNVFAVQEEQVEEVAVEEVAVEEQTASLNESTDFDRMKQFLTRLNG